MAHDAVSRSRMVRAIALYLTDLAVTTPLDASMVTWSIEGTAGDLTRLQVRFLIDADALVDLAADVGTMDELERLQVAMRAGHIDPCSAAEPPRTPQTPREASHVDDQGTPLDAAAVGDAEPAAGPSTAEVVTALMPYICGTCKTRWPSPEALRGHRRLVHGAH